LKPVAYGKAPAAAAATVSAARKPAVRALVGVDVFVNWDGGAEDLARRVGPLGSVAGGLALTTISNRGIKVWPDGFPETMQTEHWQCRFLARDSGTATPAELADLLGRAAAAGVDFIKTENLYTFDGERGYSLGQGE
jgi:isocitrate dehydrogenase